MGRFSWHDGYGAFTVSESRIDHILSYIRQQEKHHKVLTFQEEYENLLNKHGVGFDSLYLWR